MPYQVFATVTGVKQGAFKGESTQKGREGKIAVTSISYGVTIPRDATSGLATGRRIQHPVIFSKHWGVSSPQFFAAAFQNEILKSVLFEYYSQAPDGSVKVDHTVKLTNATIAEVDEAFASVTPMGAVDNNDVQTISLTFQKIEITSNAGGTTAIDDWEPNV